MKKGKYQVEMRSDDVYFAKRQVDNLFESLLKTKGKVRVVLPPITPEKVMKEAKELEKQSILKETPPVRLIKQEKQEPTPVKSQEVETVKEVIETKKFDKVIPETLLKKEEEKVAKIIEEIIKEKPPEPKKVETLLKKEEEKVVKIIEEVPPKEEIKAFSEEEVKIIEKADKILREELLEDNKTKVLPAEEVEEITETPDEKIKNNVQGNLFESILAEKTQEIETEEAFEEKQLVKAPLKTKKTFTFKSIISDKSKSSISNGISSKQKAGFKNIEIEEPEVQTIKPNNVTSSQDEELAKLLEEKIKKSLPKSENKVIYADEQEITSVNIIEPDLNYEEELTQGFESLGELIAIKKPQTKLDYLLLTAYYLQTIENLFKYSLKQLNSKAMPFLGSLIDHSIIHNAVAHDFIEVVPDYNGTSEVTEYRLTPVGENYLINEL